eukprot:436192_1
MTKSLLGTSSFLSLYSKSIWFNRILFIIGLMFICFIIIFHCIQMYCTSHTAKIQSQIEETVVSHSAETPSPNSIEHSTSSYTNRSSKRKKSVSKETNYKSLNTFLTILMLIFTFAFQLHILLGMFGVMYKWFGNIKYCGFFSNLASIFWHSAKCVIYNILILRMKMAFDGSVYAYSNKIIYSFVIFVNIFWMYAIFGDSTEIYGTWEYIPSENAFWCQVHMAVFGVVIRYRYYIRSLFTETCFYCWYFFCIMKTFYK